MRRLILFTLRVGEVIALKTAHVCGSLFAKYIIILARPRELEV
jgi:hypothetical protein